MKGPNGERDVKDVEECVQAAVADLQIEGLHCADEEIDFMRECFVKDVPKKKYVQLVLKRMRGL